ncbi:hypothetical protein QWY14_10520 [Planococcus sp. N028]|uniref:Peptidase MA-like domain-containing protein n=1 Tax=Planococcus shixiaomingii TaxID=3058393 RepID=A0ABT8N2W6_9BACL|nr:hypothetical protein [Planococcus sp. N028]MDN7242235.1 hypothetical protein [Planococcus sp. N028]
MKKTIKLAILVFVLLVSSAFLLLLVGSFILYHDIADEEEIKLTYWQSIKAIATQNAEGDREIQLKESRLQENHKHISIYYEQDFSDLMPIAKETLDLAMEKTEVLFGRTSPEPIDLLVFQDGEELAEFAEIEGVGGIYSDFDKVLAIHYHNKDLILKRDQLGLSMFQEVVLHEYAHYAFAHKASSEDAYPYWFIEGVAEYAGDVGQGAVLPTFELISFNQLTTYEHWHETRYTVGTDNYAQSHYAINFLIDKYGEKAVSKIMDSVNETKDFEQSLQSITGLTLDEFESAFVTSYEKIKLK